MTEKDKQIITLYNSGLSIKQVGERVGKSKSGVQYTLKKYSIPTNRTYLDYHFKKYACNEEFFKTIDTEEKAYFLGFIMADGCVMEERSVVTLTIHEKDIEILEKFKKALNSTYPIRKCGNHYVRIEFCSQIMVKDLVNLGVKSRKTKKLKMPLLENKDMYRHLIRGYFDGDGSIWYDKSSNSYSIQFIGTENVLNSMKLIMNWSNNKLRATSEEKVIFRLGYRGNVKVSEIMSELYEGATVYLKRKHERFQKCLELRKYNEENKNIIWTNNLGSYVRKNVK